MHFWTAPFVLAGLGLLGPGAARPTSTEFDPLLDDFPVNGTHPFADFGPALDARADKVPLRILSLGASIMAGVGSTTGDGLRKPLRDALRFDGYEVNMVGYLKTGEMMDRDHEAVPGDILTQIRTRLQRSLGYKANIVIINAGTNDAVRNIDTAHAGERLNDMLNDIWGAEDMAGTCVMVSTLLNTTDPTGSVQRVTMNQQYRDLVKTRNQEGKCVYLADMDPPEGVQHGWISTWDDYKEGENPHTHPNDEGHRKMAFIFYEAINKAIRAGKVLEPQAKFEQTSPICDKFSGTGIYPGGKTQRGTGFDDSVYRHDSEEMGIVWSADSEWDRDQWRFGRLFSRDWDDFIAWIKDDDDQNHFAVWANSQDGKGAFNKINDFACDLYCDPAGLYFIDMNADGLDDIVCIDSKGNADLAINQGNGDRSAKKPPTFKNLGRIKDNEGKGRSNVVMADIDGDGRGDYGVMDSKGTISFWRNGWVEDKPKYWQALGVRWTDQYTREIKGVRFEDINGDGRDDWMWMDKTGATTTFTNSRSCKKGKEGDGLNVAWRQGFYGSEGTGPTHKGLEGYVTKSESDLRKRLHFARVYGGSSSFGNLHLQDYVFLEHSKVDGKHRFQMRIWKNTGGGGSKLKMDGNKYCNMVGHEDGREDYVWTWSNGKMELFINRGKASLSDDDALGFWDWTPGVIWTPPRAMHRLDLHLADWDGDGACDIIYVDPETNAVEVFINQYPKDQKWEFTQIETPSGLNCPHKRGIGVNDLAVRFAHLTYAARVDFLCLAPDGKVTGAIQRSDGTFADVGQIKVAEGHDRAMLRFADVNGDGRDDLLWIEKFSGDTFVWYNEGMDNDKPLGSAFYWRKQEEKAFAGLAAGTCLFYPDLTGDLRADEHYVLESFNNVAETSFSPSCGLTDLGGDDSDPVVDPKLPQRETVEKDPDDVSEDDNPDGGICGYSYHGMTQATLKATWINSGAEEWFSNFIDKNGVSDWSNNYFRVATGKTGGSPYTCTDLHSGTCPAPSVTCTDYTPNEAFFVHVQIANMHSAFHQVWELFVENAVENLSSGIKDIIDTYGTPPEDDTPMVLNMLVGIFTSLAGIGGFIPATSFLAGVANPLTLMAGITAMAAVKASDSEGMDPDDLNDELEKVYGHMYKHVVQTLGATVTSMFAGTGTEGVEDSDLPAWIKGQFKDGAWLSGSLVTNLTNAYTASITSKFEEFALVRAMQTKNKEEYYFIANPSDFTITDYSKDKKEDITKESCEYWAAGYWYDDHCLAMGHKNGDGKKSPLVDDDIDELKKHIPNYREALVNNYKCLQLQGDKKDIPDPTIPTVDDINLAAPIEYPDCFYNFKGGKSDVWHWRSANA